MRRCTYDGLNIDLTKPDYDLLTYTVNRMDNEILEMNNILKAIDGNNESMFAYLMMKIHDTAYLGFRKYKFAAAAPGMLPIDKVNLNNLGSYMENRVS